MPIEWLADESHSVCVFKNLTGRDCYGCGMLRATVSAFHLNFRQAWEFNKLIVVALPVLAWLWARWVVDVVRRIKREK